MQRKNRLLENKIFLRILALFLAVILWLFVAGDRQEVLGFEIRIAYSGIPLTWRNLGEDLEVVEMEETVTLSLQGAQHYFDGLTPADLEAYVDLEGKGEGKHELRVHAFAPPGLNIVRIEPPKVNVQIEELVVKQMSVEGITSGEPPDGKIVSTLEFQPEEVFIQGPYQKVEEVEKVIFEVHLENAQEELTTTSQLVPLDRYGAPVEHINILPDNEVQVQVQFMLPQKVVPVQVELVGNGSLVDEIMIEPSTVEIEGPRQLLEELEYIYTEQLSLEGREEGFTQSIPLVFPEDISPVEQEEVRVRITLH